MPFYSNAGQGLSPRVRGNRTAILTLSELQRSIPACAGEPPLMFARHPAGEVYPRVCGGTLFGLAVFNYAMGLSPRVRGNLTTTLAADVDSGSIPACAGEPRYTGRPLFSSRVYPRVCGGTRHWGQYCAE